MLISPPAGLFGRSFAVAQSTPGPSPYRRSHRQHRPQHAIVITAASIACHCCHLRCKGCRCFASPTTSVLISTYLPIPHTPCFRHTCLLLPLPCQLAFAIYPLASSWLRVLEMLRTSERLSQQFQFNVGSLGLVSWVVEPGCALISFAHSLFAWSFGWPEGWHPHPSPILPNNFHIFRTIAIFPLYLTHINQGGTGWSCRAQVPSITHV